MRNWWRSQTRNYRNLVRVGVILVIAGAWLQNAGWFLSWPVFTNFGANVQYMDITQLHSYCASMWGDGNYPSPLTGQYCHSANNWNNFLGLAVVTGIVCLVVAAVKGYKRYKAAHVLDNFVEAPRPGSDDDHPTVRMSVVHDDEAERDERASYQTMTDDEAAEANEAAKPRGDYL